MNKSAFRSLALSAVLSVALAGTAAAGVINFSTNSMGNPTPTNTNLGATYMFWGGLTATQVMSPSWGTTCTGTSDTTDPCLIYKTNANPVETGLGLTMDPDSDNEVFNPYGVALSVSSGYIWGIELGSVQAGESWAVLGCAANYTNCTNVLDSGVGGYGGGAADTVTLTNLGRYGSYIVDVPCANSTSTHIVYCTGTVSSGKTDSWGNDINIMAVTAVPEPGTLALFAAGLLGCVLFLRRRSRQN